MIKHCEIGCFGARNLLKIKFSNTLKDFFVTSLFVWVLLFVKVFQPGDSEGTFSVFESSCHLLLPV